ncbi:UNVERIFIED_CONTAM: hypothetical protein GTU68_039351 [Idotea baltica]|nr:hypothetical protein [Idotea baltica]
MKKHLRRLLISYSSVPKQSIVIDGILCQS